MTFAHIAVTLVLASNASGKTLVRTNQGTVVPVAAYSGPLIADDSNTVCHATFNSAAIQDAKGCLWSMNGTVPQVAKSGKNPPGAGPYSVVNFYSLGTGNDALDFTGDWSACIVFSKTAAATSNVIFSNGVSGASGYGIVLISGTTPYIYGTGAVASTANTVSTSALNVVCAGRSNTSALVKLNLGALASGTYTYAAGTSAVAYLGKWASGTPASEVTVHEAWFSTTTPTDALFTAIMQRVKLRAQVTAW